MTNRQSNIIFYCVISIIVYVIIVNNFYPDFFEDFTKSKTELSIKEAESKGEHSKALMMYQDLVREKVSGGEEASPETADIYEAMANLHLLQGNKAEAKNHYLKALGIREQSNTKKISNIITTYNKLGSIAQGEEQYDEAQMYYEKSLAKMLGNSQVRNEGDEGVFEGLQNAQEGYKRLNNEWTITAFKKLGEIHQIKKEYPIAKEYYDKALAASKLTFGEDDVKTQEIIGIMERFGL